MQQATAVFSNAAARTAAITSPVEGQLTYLEDVDRYEHYNGTAWTSPFGLTRVLTQTIGSAVSTVVVNNAFSTIYDNYKVLITGSTASVEGTSVRLSLSGSTGNTYNWAGGIQIYNGTNTFTGSSSTNSFQVSNTGLANSTHIELTFMSPFISTATGFVSQFGSSSSAGRYGGFDNNAVSHTGFTFFAGTGTLTGGTVSVYGYRKS
jgi:hypothetical protein